MKLALARAMLMNADIMLLDEPTNHLDTTNVAWLVSYLTGLKGVSPGRAPRPLLGDSAERVSLLRGGCLRARTSRGLLFNSGEECGLRGAHRRSSAAAAPPSAQVTSVVVSHDSGFLDAVCSSIIHYEDNFKLKKYLGASRGGGVAWTAAGVGERRRRRRLQLPLLPTLCSSTPFINHLHPAAPPHTPCRQPVQVCGAAPRGRRLLQPGRRLH